jgi:hypothetical protein
VLHCLLHRAASGHNQESFLVRQTTLLSLIQTGALCCLSMSSRTFLYQVSGLVSVMLQLNVWPQTFSSFWHCSNSFLLLLWAALQTHTHQCYHNLPHEHSILPTALLTNAINKSVLMFCGGLLLLIIKLLLLLFFVLFWNLCDQIKTQSFHIYVKNS